MRAGRRDFSDADYQLAAYAALRVLTQYKGIEDIDVAYELARDWTQRPILVEMIGFLGRLPMPPWAGDAEAARLLAGALANDHV